MRLGALDVADHASGYSYEVGRRDFKDVVPGAGRGPDGRVLQQIFVDEDPQRCGMAQWWHAADRKASDPVDGVGVDASALVAASKRRQLLLIELIRATHVRQHDFTIDCEDQALHNLTDLDTDRIGGIDCGLGTVRKAARRNLQATCTGGQSDLGDIGMFGGHTIRSMA